MRTTRIAGTGSALPQKTVTNEELSNLVETSDQWIRSRTGIQERQIAGEEENVVTLAAEAGGKALEDSGIRPEEIQLVVVATCSSNCQFPSVGCQVQERLHLTQAAAMDLSAACTGFLYGLHLAHAYISGGIYDKVLVIGAETLSRIIDWEDRSTCVLFGDGAGACVVKADEQGIEKVVIHSDGTGGSMLRSQSGALKTPAFPGTEARPLQMEGQEVFKFAVRTVPSCLQEVMELANVPASKIRYFVLHQANARILQAVAKRLNVELDQFPMNLQYHGNTSAASIPILLDEMNRSGMLKRGDLIACAGFGAGLTWGAALLHW